MRIKYLKDHHPFKAGEETDSDNAGFLIRYKIAEEVIEPTRGSEGKAIVAAKEYIEKLEVQAPKASFKEKRENKKGNVPTAVKKAKK